ncbi:hypothetical protein [Methylobacterium nodulans]|uniref:Uncharacterized protein n=1 Tax=Methylobacterium nodulans (strain LMG 21967 / CNCM I-2342 / ORS 2060) TaxID=460265 RepID=B8IFS3_METNO|nr:hypothetical protein [Methylobacterium nodulans]ACL59633.1 conserved hypothetical protein [Methylobacterium nodulans ORS 2060]
MGRRWLRLGADALGVGALWLGMLMVAGGDGAAALGLRPGLDPVALEARAASAPAPVRVILPTPWAHATAAFAEEARQAATRPAAFSGSR